MGAVLNAALFVLQLDQAARKMGLAMSWHLEADCFIAESPAHHAFAAFFADNQAKNAAKA